MRIGQNPVKNVKDVAKPERVTVAVLNFIPFLSGFYADMLDVLKTCLNSIRSSADLPFDLLVFDNGSCPEVCDFLVNEKNAGRIQHLMLSEKNLGKGGAWNMILAGAPGDIIAYTDNDCYFYPGWLSESVKILETYPNTGMVTARPFHTLPELYSRTLEWAENTPGVEVEKGSLVPFETLHEFNLSLGQTDEYSRGLIAASQDIRLTYQGVKAYVGGSHWQFTCHKEVISKFLPFMMDRPMGQVRQLDRRMNEAGFLRLMTADALAMNMSNSVPPEFGGSKHIDPARRPGGLRRLADMPLVKSPLMRLYHAIFQLYYE